jgi:hypothetical protein
MDQRNKLSDGLMNMSYRQLANATYSMTEEQKDMSVTVYVPGIDEFYPIDRIDIVNRSDVLDIGHPVLNISNGE